MAEQSISEKGKLMKPLRLKTSILILCSVWKGHGFKNLYGNESPSIIHKSILPLEVIWLDIDCFKLGGSLQANRKRLRVPGSREDYGLQSSDWHSLSR